MVARPLAEGGLRDVGASGDARAPVLQVRHLDVTFGQQARVHAVIDVNLEVCQGERVGLIGESGSGKSVTAMSVLRLHDERDAHIGPQSSIVFQGEDILRMGPRQLRALRGSRIGMIFQDPMGALNPTRRVGRQISGLLERLDGMPGGRARRVALDLLEEVGLPDPKRTYHAYPHQLSGGMRQRVLIAMVLAREPRVLIADEPTSSLDVTVQAALLEMLKQRVEDRGISVLMITHDLGVVAQFCQRVYVMYGGRVVEEGPVGAILQRPAHPYTTALAACVPRIAGELPEELPVIRGRQATRRSVPTGCGFAERCDFVEDRCRAAVPEMLAVARTGTRAACIKADLLAADR